MKLKLKLYAFLAEKLGTASFELNVDKKTTIQDIINQVDKETGGKLSKLILSEEGNLKQGFSILQNGEAIPSEQLDQPIKDSEELLIFPPFSGGTVPHKHKKETPEDINFGLATVSSSRYQMKLEEKEIENRSADLAEAMIEKAGYTVTKREIIPDRKNMIRKVVNNTKNTDIQLFLGGTGIAPDDQTPEALQPLFDKELSSFSQLFTFLSYKQVGSATVLSRAKAGIHEDMVLIALPGSPDAIKLALKNIILPEAGHILKLMKGE